MLDQFELSPELSWFEIARKMKGIGLNALQQWKGEKELLKCPCCKGDGRETCTNPDHGFIEAMPGEIGRLGCPVCGHDPNHKVKNGGQCEVCNGTGKVNKDQFNQFCIDTGYDNEPEPEGCPYCGSSTCTSDHK